MLRRPSGGISRVAVPVRALLQRFGLLVLLCLSATVMVVGKVEPEAAHQVRAAVSDIAAPVLDAMSRPVESANQVVDEVVGLMALHEENARLHQALERAKTWELASRRLQQENASLRGLLGLQVDGRPAYVSARVIGDSGSAFVRTMLVNAGAGDGIEAGQAAITGDGLVGRVVEAGRRSSRILLVTDLNSRLPVVIESTRQPAVLAGDNSPLATLAFLPRDAEVRVGMRIVTSGHGRVIPPGIPVGVITEIESSLVRVQPIADLSRVEYVRLIDWEAPAFEPIAEPQPILPVAEEEPAAVAVP
jgi:rod shape-determining protein MreC